MVLESKVVERGFIRLRELEEVGSYRVESGIAGQVFHLVFYYWSSNITWDCSSNRHVP